MLREAVGRALRFVAVVLAVALLAASCASSENGAADGGATAEVPIAADSFCALWADTKTQMDYAGSADLNGLNAYLEARDAATTRAPDELTAQLAAIAAWDDQIVEILYAVDFDWEVLTDEIVSVAFGSVEAVETAEVAQETAVDQIDRWTVRNCGAGVGDALTFCGIWTDIIVTLDGQLPDSNMDPESEGAHSRFADLIAQGDAAAPTDIREQWDPIADYHLTWHDLLVTVKFDESLISDGLLTDTFGSPEAAAAAAASAASSVTAVEAWAATGCGDFCARQHEMLETIGELGGRLDERAADPYGLLMRTRSLAHADVLMPNELRVYWEPVSAELTDWMGWWESHDYDRQQLSTPEAQLEAIEIYRQADYLSFLERDDGEVDPQQTAAIEAWRAGESDLTEDFAAGVSQIATAPLWERPGFASAVFEIDQWAALNCTTERGRGGPGLVEVRFSEVTGAAGSLLVLAMGPVDSTVADLATPEQFSVGSCRTIDRDPWGVELAQDEEGGLETQYGGDQLGSRPDQNSEAFDSEDPLCGWHGERVPLAPGDYTLVAAIYETTPRPGTDARPTHCLALDVTVSGDTLVDVPELPDCDLTDAPPAPGEWGYNEPVSPSTAGAGTLKVRISSQVIEVANQPGGGAQYVLRAMALPHGTTLNEVGREEVFPPAAGCVWLWAAQSFPEGLEQRPVELPLGTLPSEGLRECLDPDWLNGAAPIRGAPAGEPAADARLPLAVLAPGIYDVYVSDIRVDSQRNSFCVSFEATVDGDTVIDLPVDLGELEPC